MHQKIKESLIFLKKDLWLSLALGLFSVLAWWGFWKQGIVNFDEAYFIVVVRTFSELFKGLLLHPVSFFTGSLLSDVANNYGNVYTAARPSYILASSFLSLFVPASAASRLVSLLSGYLLIVFFRRLLGIYVHDGRVRSALTLLPALSPLLLVYSRLGLSQLFSAAFLAIATYYLLSYHRQSSSSDMKKFCLSASVLFMSHYNVVFLVFFLLVLGGLSLKGHGGKLKDWLSYAVYFLALPLAWEAVTQVASFVAGNRLGDGQKVLAYSGEFLSQLTKAQVSEEAPFGQLLYYPNLFLSAEGLFVSLFLVLGMVVALRHIKRFEYQVLLVPLLFSLLLFAAAPLKFPRNLVSVWPSLYLVVALGLERSSHLFFKRCGQRGRYWAMSLLLLLALSPHALKYRDYLRVDTGNEQTVEYIKQNYPADETIILSWSAAIWRAYLPGYASEQLVEPEKWRPKLEGRDHVLIVDDHFTAILDPKRDYAAEGGVAVFSCDTDVFKARPLILDMIYKDPKTIEAMFMDNSNSRIVVFERVDG